MVKRVSCLLLTMVLVFTFSVPVVWGDDTPISDGGQIHPWDNNDDYQRDKGSLDSSERPVVIIQFGPGGLLTASWVRISHTSSETSSVTSTQKGRLTENAEIGTSTLERDR